MSYHQKKIIISIICDENGKIFKFIHDELNLSQTVIIGQMFTALIDKASIDKAFYFLTTLKTEGTTFDWSLNVLLNDNSIMLLHFAGGMNEHQMLIIGATTPPNADLIFNELMKINHEQTNLLCEVIKQQLQISHQQQGRDNQLYEQLMQLNNELTNTQRELTKKNIELEQQRRELKLKNQMLGIAAHDLRNPLGVIQGFSSLLQEELTDSQSLNAEQQKFFQVILNTTQFALNLVNELLDVVKIEAGQLKLKRQTTDLSTLIKQAISLNHPLGARKQIQLNYHCDDPLPPMVLDAVKIQQVLNNLLSNAIKYSHPQTQVDLQITQEAQQLIIAVKDQGQGIPATELGKLFQPFSKTSVRTTAGESSTGLGLLICRKIVEGHQGQIWVESQEGKGSTFYVALPLDTSS